MISRAIAAARSVATIVSATIASAATIVSATIASAATILSAAALAGCGPSPEEQADMAIVGAIESLIRTEANETVKREELVTGLEGSAKGSAEGEAARAACARYYRTQIDLRRTLDKLDELAPKDKPDVEPTLEILANLATAEDLSQKAASELDPCTQSTTTLRIKSKYKRD